MIFSDININKIMSQGYDKLLILKNGQLLVGGKINNVLINMDVLKNKTVTNQFGDQDIWVVELKD
jgi:ABC-type cobalamin transport system ATPase subunit